MPRCIPEEYATRGVLYAPAGASQLTACGGSASNAANTGVAADANSTAQQFAFVQANEKYYLYSVSEKKFVTEGSSRAKINYTPADYVTTVLHCSFRPLRVQFPPVRL